MDVGYEGEGDVKDDLRPTRFLGRPAGQLSEC